MSTKPKKHHYGPKCDSQPVKYARAIVTGLSQLSTVTCYEQGIALAVIGQSIYDLALKPRFDGDMRYKRTCQWWLDGSADGWCNLLGLNAEWVVEVLNRVGLITRRSKRN